MKTRLNMLALMRWEAIRSKPFALMDWRDGEDTETLLYVVHGLPRGLDPETFKATAGAVKLRRRWLSGLAREMELQALSMPPSRESGGGDGKPAYLSEKVPQLIAMGLDAEYALHRMTLPELYILGEAFVAKERDRLEWQRYLAYCTIMPHCKPGSLKKGPRALCLFAWEEEEARAISQKEIRMFEAFMASAKPRMKKHNPES